MSVERRGWGCGVRTCDVDVGESGEDDETDDADDADAATAVSECVAM